MQDETIKTQPKSVINNGSYDYQRWQLALSNSEGKS